MGRMKSYKGPNYKKKGRPGGGEREHQVGFRDVGIDNLKQDQEIAEKYTEGDDEDPAENVQVRHPNRNTDKPDIDKPPYS